jgi:hypothetical protein
MSEPIELRPLRGRNPRGFFGALGAFDVATRALADVPVTLMWTDTIEPAAVITGPRDLDHLVELCDQDRDRWARSPLLAWGPDDLPAADLKIPPDSVARWFETALASGERGDADLLAALLAEGPVSGKDEAKPTHFHFTAGQQKFLAKVRELRGASDADALREALAGPWRYASKVTGLGWDAGSERIHAYRAIAPTKEASRPTGVPGADWLAFLGLRFFPVAARGDRLTTTGCSGRWKSELFTWPLWRVPAVAPVVAALVGRGDLAAMPVADRHALGVHHLLRAPIRRSDQGGYGSFGAPDAVLGEEPPDAR